ncbi:MAG TPA: zf-HC2 domain-containing protein [Longimicrobiaceae bacterium]|nr:zf-HC2 domain-containing protein [Longimicrobiaceae bacterium]
MNHPDEGTLQALLDGEVAGADRADVEGHLAGCATCREAYDEAAARARALREALSCLDVPAPVAPARRRVAARRRFGGRAALPWAAVFVLVAATALSATVPGSPLRRWWSAAAERATAAPASVQASAAAAPAPEPASGVSVRPVDGRLRVSLVDAAPGLRLGVRFGEASRASVTASGEAAGASFRTGPGSIEVRGAGPGRVEVAISRAVKDFSLSVNGRVYLVGDGAGLRVSGPASAPAGPEIEFEVPR